MFKECCAKQFYTLLSGKLYTCQYLYQAYELNATKTQWTMYLLTKMKI